MITSEAISLFDLVACKHRYKDHNRHLPVMVFIIANAVLQKKS